MGDIVPLPGNRRRGKRGQRVPCQVLSFVPRCRGPVVEHATVRLLELLLRQALLGRIDGIAWAVAVAPEYHAQVGWGLCDFAGIADRDPALRERLALALNHKASAISRGEAVER